MTRNPRDMAQSVQMISRRALILGGAQLGVLGLLGWRMESLQVEQADQFRLLAEENRVNIRLLAPARGLIFDRDGVPLAVNEQNYRIVIVREDAGDVDAVLERLRRLVPLSDETIARAKEEMDRRSAFVPVTLADRLSWEDVAEVAVNTPALPGITAEVGLSRGYPLGADMAHVVGYVGPVSDFDLSQIEEPDPLLQIPRFPIGKTGVEAKEETRLRGSAGTRQIEVNAVGRVMRELERIEGEPGADLQLTIDAGLQNYALERMAGQSASAVVMDLESGAIRAIASAPSFDPNLFVRGISVAGWEALNTDPYRPLAAKAVQGIYPPGSTFKIITALAGLEAGIIDSEETVFCGGNVTVSGNRFHCWRSGGHGNMNLNDSMKESCDVYYYEVAQEIGIDRIAEMARRLGLGERHELPLSAVARGIAPDRAWKARTRGEDWRIGDTVNASIGQGYVLSSPLQLAVMTARLATGRALSPHLVQAIDNVPVAYPEAPSLGLNENNLRRIRASLFDASNLQRGTGFESRIVAADYAMAGKTGTSQVRRITAEEREAGIVDNEDLPWERRDHALFVCYAPYDAPRYAVSVVVEHGGSGAAAAAPIARDVLLQALYGGTPPLEAYPANQRATIAQQQRELELREIERDQTGSDRA